MFEKISQFDHAELEEEIHELAREVGNKINTRNGIESKDAKELLKDFLKEKISQEVNLSDASKERNSFLKGSEIVPDYLSNLPSAIKLEVAELLDIVFHKGLRAAVREAKKKSPFLTDAFHDALTNGFYDEMQKRNLI